MNSARLRRLAPLAAVAAVALPASAQAEPSVVDPNLAVRTVASGFTTPTSVAFTGLNEMLVAEKNTGRVQRVVNGVQTTVLDLAVNNNSERGLLGVALSPDFVVDRGVYLYWTCAAPGPEQRECSLPPALGADASLPAQVPLLGNSVDRFIWNGATLVFDRHVISIRAYQADAGQPLRGNHDGGVINFGPDGKLYVQIGDVGRRGQMQNLPCGPVASCAGGTVPDDQFGGPAPDNAHLTGVILRLNPDGSAPADNPFFAAGAAMGGEVGANVQKVFAYGIRNSFGFAFDPVTGALWDEQNGDDSFTEINLVGPGANLGWVQVMGPLSRIAEFKTIETSSQFFGLQQIRWPPTNIADTPEAARAAMFMLPGAHYSDPEFSWKFEVAPAGLGFLRGHALGPQYENDMFVGAARTDLLGGQLWRFDLTGNRRKIAVDDPRLEDRVADNVGKFTIAESETLLFGRNFGVGTDIETGPNGNLFVVSLSDGAVYEIHRTR